ncbi:MAG: mechanosensitive ion channel [Deltaproteobacteria bacterium]|nr:mechanosensitive ion channel [Deltaproteobacteria bacterium]
MSVFLGVLLSLGSTGAVANAISGIVLTYMRAFDVGDRVKIADATGDVIEKTTFVTRLRTVKNVEITIPNAMVMGNPMINYSAPARRDGVVLHTAVTIGYDVPWRKVHALLVAAALEAPDLEPEPRPFVLQTALEDYYVRYELNAWTKKPENMPAIARRFRTTTFRRITSPAVSGYGRRASAAQEMGRERRGAEPTDSRGGRNRREAAAGGRQCRRRPRNPRRFAAPAARGPA